MPIIQLSDELSVRTYEPASIDFDPLTVPDSVLLDRGLPPRPDSQASPELRRWWEHALSHELTYIVPTFRLIEGKTHGPLLKSESGETSTSINWSGSVVSIPNPDHSLLWIEGRWTVPNPYPSTPDGSGGIGDQASAWVGIGGVTSNDIFQAGTETDAWPTVILDGAGRPLLQRDYYVWWEWYPDYEVRIENFPVAPGDVIWCLLAAYSSNSGTVHISNISSGSYTTFAVMKPLPRVLVGDTVEWIVERPKVNGSLPGLAKYGMVYFDEGLAVHNQGTPGGTQNRTRINLGSGTLVTMTGNNNRPLSIPGDQGPRSMEVNWLAPR